MAIRIPLNRFRSKFVNLNTNNGIKNIYTAPENRASIIILAQVSNTTDTDRTISVGVSSNPDLASPGSYYLVKDFIIPKKDSRTVLSGRLVMQGADNDTVLSSEVLFAQDSTTGAGVSGLTLNLGILETINTN
jgi:hypothetical protein